MSEGFSILLYLISSLCGIFLVEALILGIAIGSVTAIEWLWKDPKKNELLQREVMVRVFTVHLRYRSLGFILRILFSIPFWLSMPTVTLVAIWLSAIQVQKGFPT